MTREEAIVDIRDNIKPIVGGISLDMAIEALEQQKTAYWLQYAERDGKTVEWVCSFCRHIKSVTSDRTEYCPICGAKMEVSE